MFTRAVRVMTIRGFDVRLDPTLLVLAALIVWTFAGQFAAQHGWPTALVMAAAGMVLFLASILAHELAHALEAVHRGIEVDSITLLVFGGVTQMHTHSSRPRDEFVIAAVGPFVSLLCGAVFGLIGTVASLWPAGAEITQLTRLLAALNVLLAVFNLVPGAPLDGGRVLRAGLWWVTGNRSRAIRWSARCGQALGLMIVAYGLFVALSSPRAYVFAVWYLAIGAFLLWAAGTEHRNSRLEELYSGARVRELLAPQTDPATGSADDPTTRAEANLESTARNAPKTPVLARLDPAPNEEALATLPRVDLDADLHALVDAFQGKHDQVLITDQAAPIGSVTESEVARAVAYLRGNGRKRIATAPTDAEVAR